MKKCLLAAVLSVLSLPVFASDDLLTLFQREHAYLVSQRESARRQLSEARRSHTERKRRTDAEIMRIEKEVATLSVRNDETYERVQRMEKEHRELQSRDVRLRSLYKKASQELARLERETRFEKGEEGEAFVPPDLHASSFGSIAERSLRLMDELGKVDEIRAHYRDHSGKLVEATVRRFGSLAAQALTPSGERALGPSDEGILAEIDTGREPLKGMTAIYAFASLKEKAAVRKQPQFVDHLASFTPGVLLAGLFAIVGGLFAVLLRE